MKPIRDCAYGQEDGCCGYPTAPTPECHAATCPRLSPDVYGVIAEQVDALKAQQTAIRAMIAEWDKWEMLGALDRTIYQGALEMGDAAIAKAKGE